MKNQRLQSLDSLRGIAALAVVLFHFTVIIERYVPNFHAQYSVPYGYFGVELFFIISGFVIFMTIQRSQTGLDFVISRFSRLYPTFWACLSLTFIIGLVFPLADQKYSVAQYLINFTMLQEYVKQPNIDGVYWSLTYELGFYFLMFMIFQLEQLKHIEKFCLLWTITPIIFHYFYPYIPHPLHYLFLINKYSHLFAAGICFFLIKTTGFSALRWLILTSTVITQWIITDWQTALLILTFLFLFYIAMLDKAGFLKFKPLIFLGGISYPLYLIHQMIGFRIIDTLHNSLSMDTTSSILLTLAIIICLASAISYLIEKPSASYLRKLYRNRLLTIQ